MSADEKDGVTNIDNSPDKLCEPLAWYSLKRPPEEGIEAAHAQTKTQRTVKPKRKPRRPLSGYNVFFREERGKWDISSIQSSVANATNNGDSAFRTMTKAIGKRWRNLSADQKLQYERIASADMQRYRKEMDEYKLQMIRETAIGRVYLKGSLIKVTGTPEISYREVCQQLPQTMKDIEEPQASSPDIRSIAGGQARSSKEVQAEQNTSFSKEWTASSDTTYSRQDLSRTNPSRLENPLVVQERVCDESRSPFIATSHQNKWNEQTQHGASGRNEKAEPSSELPWEMMRVDPLTPSNIAGIMEADLQSSLSSFTQRHEFTKYNRSNSTSQVNPSVPTDVTSFLQQEQLPTNLKNANRCIQSVAPLASPDAIMSEHLSSRILQRFVLPNDDNNTRRSSSTHTHSAQALTQHQPTIFDNLCLGIGSSLQTTRSVMEFLTSQNLPLPTDRRQSQWREQLSDYAAFDLDHRVHSNIAMQLMQRAQQSPSLKRPVYFATPYEFSLSPNTSFHIPDYSSDFTVVAGADASAQIDFANDYNTTSSAASAFSRPIRFIDASRSPSHFSFPTLAERAITAARSDEEGSPTAACATGTSGRNTSKNPVSRRDSLT